MHRLLKLNRQFLNNLRNSLSMNNCVISCMPSLMFLISAMLIAHIVTHSRHLVRGYSWKHTIARELLFQWSFYYITKFWISCVKMMKLADNYAQQLVRMTAPENQELYKYLVHLIFLCLYVSISSIPLLILIHNHFLYRPSLPNFMVWVGASRWDRTEMGPSGYYLDRPLRRTSESIPRGSLLPAYRVRRSCSVDQVQFINQMQAFPLLNDEFNTLPHHTRTPLSITHGSSERLAPLRSIRSMAHLTPISSMHRLAS